MYKLHETYLKRVEKIKRNYRKVTVGVISVTVGLLLGEKGNEFQSLGAATMKEGPPR